MATAVPRYRISDPPGIAPDEAPEERSTRDEKRFKNRIMGAIDTGGGS